jgi:hypothetical protein
MHERTKVMEADRREPKQGTTTNGQSVPPPASTNEEDEHPGGSVEEQQVKRDQRWMVEASKRAIRVTDIEALTLAAKADPILWPSAEHMSSQELRQWYECETARQREALHKFRDDLRDREREAFRKGAASAYDRKAFFASEIRSFVLLLVVLAVLAMPLVAIWKDLPPEKFGTLIAPVTALAGTVVGYWFGAGERHKSGKEQ